MNCDNIEEGEGEMISMKDFLNFLSITYRVNNATKDLTNIQFNWNELKDNILLKSFFNCNYSSDDYELITKNVENNLKEKLNEILNEGIFDSVLCYLAVKQNNNNNNNNETITVYNKKEQNEINKQITANNNNNNQIIKTRKKEKKKKICDSKQLSKTENDIEIHVYDEMKGYRKDFRCPHNLLVSTMGYFSEVTKGQKLEDMDISVHCDISIFDWLMRWTKRELNGYDQIPKLDNKNTIPIMVSASFLQMNQLFEECLLYCKNNINDIVKFSPNLSCLSDHILKSLGDLLRNTEVQAIKDKKDKIKSRLFCKLIISLNEITPDVNRGHYATLANLYFCSNCTKLVPSNHQSDIPCHFNHLSINPDGRVISNHQRDEKWNLNDHIKNIWSEEKNWCNTYWRLWAQCHFLYCEQCHTKYPVALSNCCYYHPQQPYFYPIEQLNAANSPTGKYPCCGSKAVRYETVDFPTGCKFQNHIPRIRTTDEKNIQIITEQSADLIKLKCQDVQPIRSDQSIKEQETNTKKEKEDVTKGGLLSGPLYHLYAKSMTKYMLNERIYDVRNNNTYPDVKQDNDAISNNNNDNEIEDNKLQEDWYSIGDSENSEMSSICEQILKQVNNTTQSTSIDPSGDSSATWLSKYSTRHNQDRQRNYEEIAFQNMSDLLLQNIKQNFPNSIKNHDISSGGSYIQIEAKWRETQRSRTIGNACTSRQASKERF